MRRFEGSTATAQHFESASMPHRHQDNSSNCCTLLHMTRAKVYSFSFYHTCIAVRSMIAVVPLAVQTACTSLQEYDLFRRS